jgi:putative ABC transport system permease protein
VVTAAFARKAFGELDPIGQVFGYDDNASKEDWTVVGVVADMRVNGVRTTEPPMFYTCAPQANSEGLYFLAVRFEGAVAPVLEGVRGTFARLEPGLVFTNWKTLQTRMTDDLSGDLAVSRLTGIFGGCAILLAAAGVAGSLGYLVVLRQRELALRMAIGADPGRVLRSVLFDALRLCAFGGVAGLLIVWLVPQFPALKTILYRRPGLDSALLAAAVALVAATIAGWFPARRASRIDPMLTLKSE